MLVAVVGVPALLGLLALVRREPRFQLALLLLGAVVHGGLTVALWRWRPEISGDSLLGADSLGLLVLGVLSLLFACVSLYSVSYLLHGTHDTPAAPHLYVPFLLGFLSTLSLLALSHNLALLWVATEATTLVTAPLVSFYRRGPALEAAWKYLMLGSVGIALALLGTFFLGIAASNLPGDTPRLSLPALVAHAGELSRPWLKAAFVLALVGYGTKMGLAPLHTWLPDAHSQAPSPVSALLSGALLNGALLGILRFLQVCIASGEGAFAQALLVLLGFLSLAVAAVFLLGQRDYKRLLAYSSVENMGVIAIGVGLGDAAVRGALLHLVNHSLAKGALFLLAGNLLRASGTTRLDALQGAAGRLPVTGPALLVALLAAGGAPPSGLFMSELAIFQAALLGGAPGTLALLFVSLLVLAFLGMAGAFLPALQGPAAPRGSAPAGPDGPEAARRRPRGREPWLSTAPPAVLLLGVLTLGVYLPGFLARVLEEAGAVLR